MNIKTLKKVIIWGYGESGKAAEKVLQSEGISYKIFDDNEKISHPKKIKKLTNEAILESDLIIISPGVSIFNPRILFAQQYGVGVVSELEFGSWFAHCPLIAITGTNGKTTTTLLTQQMLQMAKFKAKSFGNVGTALSRIYFEKDLDYAVVEVSSFQLEAARFFSPYIAVMLNLSPDHLDRHKTFENYAKSKFNLVKNQTKSNWLVVNAADSNLLKVLNEASAQVVEIGTINGFFLNENNVVMSGVSQNNNNEVFNGNMQTLETQMVVVLTNEEIGVSFKTNILALFAIAKILNISPQIVQQTLQNFTAQPSRLQLVCEKGGVRYINDSKATNPHAVSAAISSISAPIILLLGGKNKDLNFTSFFDNLDEKIKIIIVFGGAKNLLFKQAKNHALKNIGNGKKIKTVSVKTRKTNRHFVRVYKTRKLKNATALATTLSSSGDVVLLSPGCASFDEFSTYQERGEFFEKWANEFTSKKLK